MFEIGCYYRFIHGFIFQITKIDLLKGQIRGKVVTTNTDFPINYPIKSPIYRICNCNEYELINDGNN